ncbi:hypothetical protein C8R45DRAFT_943361 [Mycena sanguinolenta]|nr:hypothetical protein C8R45DRAFT_943361 [Mycena sanguinolenta]
MYFFARWRADVGRRVPIPSSSQLASQTLTQTLISRLFIESAKEDHKLFRVWDIEFFPFAPRRLVSCALVEATQRVSVKDFIVVAGSRFLPSRSCLNLSVGRWHQIPDCGIPSRLAEPACGGDFALAHTHTKYILHSVHNCNSTGTDGCVPVPRRRKRKHIRPSFDFSPGVLRGSHRSRDAYLAPIVDLVTERRSWAALTLIPGSPSVYICVWLNVGIWHLCFRTKIIPTGDEAAGCAFIFCEAVLRGDSSANAGWRVDSVARTKTKTGMLRRFRSEKCMCAYYTVHGSRERMDVSLIHPFDWFQTTPLTVPGIPRQNVSKTGTIYFRTGQFNVPSAMSILPDAAGPTRQIGEQMGGELME